MDNNYRKQWDKTVIDHVQLQMNTTNGIEIGCTIKKFPLLTPREYVLAWRLWEGKDRTFYCFIKVTIGETSFIILSSYQIHIILETGSSMADIKD